MKTKLFALLLAACLLFSLCACGGTATSTSDSNDADATVSSGDDADTATSGSDSDNADASNGEDGDDESETSSMPTSEIFNANRIQIETHYGASGQVFYWHELKYGNDGKLASVISYRANGSESGHVDITYDENGNRLNDYECYGVYSSYTDDGSLIAASNEITGTVYSVQYKCESRVNKKR